jgi:hypothetical protein
MLLQQWQKQQKGLKAEAKPMYLHCVLKEHVTDVQGYLSDTMP